MVQPDVQTYRALALLKTAEMAPILEYLKAKRIDALERAAVVADLHLLGRAQGEAAFLKQLIEDIEQSGARLRKLTSGSTR